MTPKLIAIPFGRDGNKNTIYETRQQGQAENEATWSTGFPPVTMQSKTDGGLPPLGLDFNGIFYDISSNTAYQCMGGQYYFDTEYVEKINGYPKGAILLNDARDKQYISNIDNNKVNFNTVEATELSAWSIISIIDIDKLLNAKISNTDLSEALLLKADKDRQIIAGNGLTGGGTFEQNRTLTLGTPIKITGTSKNEVTASGHSHEADIASLTQKGITQLTNAIDISEDKAATPKGVLGYVQAELLKTVPVGTISLWGGEVAPEGYLLSRGQSFSASQYPKLAVLFPSLKLPDFRGVVPRGLDDTRGFDPGRVLGSYQEDAMPKIVGELSDLWVGQNNKATDAFSQKSHNNSLAFGGGNVGGFSNNYDFDSSRVFKKTANEVRMKNIAMNFIIKAG